MSGREANCPGCGAPVRFLWAQAVQTTCPYCRSILVRHDMDLEKVGTVSAYPADASPIQIGTEGRHGGQAFQVVGRILYRYDQGGWNEWHLAFQDNSSGWLSDAQSDYAITRLASPPTPLPSREALRRGQTFQWNGTTFQVATLTHAEYAGVEGELPFEYWDKGRMHFADLRTPDARFGTIDYSEAPPLLFLGEFVEFDSLHLKNLRAFEGW